MRRKMIVIVASLIAISNSGLSATTAAETTIDYNKPGKFGFGICQSESQLDCLEPIISVSHQDGTSSTAQYISSQSNAPVVAVPAFGGSLGHDFKVISGTSTGEYKYFTVRTEFTTPANDPVGGYLKISVAAGKKIGANECDESLKKLCTRFTLDPEDKFTLVIRSQKAPVENLRATAVNGDILREDYLSGNRWILKGSQTFWGWTPELSWMIHATYPDATSTAMVIRCAGNGVLFASTNSFHVTEPSWDKRKNSLNFGIRGPHYDANGDLNKGFFKARIPKKWLDCTYPKNTLSLASEVVVSVTYEDGSSQVATFNTKVTDEIIYVDIPVLHFSSPTIRIANAAIPRPTPSPTVVNCVKGKTKKIVTGRTCPSGWKIVA